MSENKKVFWEVVSDVSKDVRDMVKTCAQYLCIAVCVLAPFAMLFGTIVYCKSNSPFCPTQSRLAQQIEAMRNASASSHLNDDELEQMLATLISNYDPKTDDLNPVLNPNAKPIDIEQILAYCKVDKKGKPFVGQPESDPKSDSKDDW